MSISVPLKLFGRVLMALAWLVMATHAHVHAATSGDLITTQTRFWVDPTGKALLDEVQQLPGSALQQLTNSRPFDLNRGALWLRYERPQLDTATRWYVVLDGSSFINEATLYQQDPSGAWQSQQSGDRLPSSHWSHPSRMPTFELSAGHTGTVWLRLQNDPSALNPSLRLSNERDLQMNEGRSLLLLGCYFGFGLMVVFLGWVHVRLYRDRVFIPYLSYVVCMLGFQASFTGIGGLYLWPDLTRFNDAAPALFTLWLTASGLWFVREVAAVSRHSRVIYRFLTAWSAFGFIFPVAYFLWPGPAAFKVLNLYGLLSVLLSMAVCVWAWRKGEVHAGRTALGFLPLHLAYVFPALRSAGLLADSTPTHYALLVGSAIEIPLLLYILHRRAQDLYENAARMRVVSSTEPLTGLTTLPVLLLRLQDTVRRARHQHQACAVLLVEVSNFPVIVTEHGREWGDRALVVAASHLTSLAREVDTVSRVSATRFALLLETPYRSSDLKLMAQHIIAKGLTHTDVLPGVTLRLRVVTVALPDLSGQVQISEEIQGARLLARLHRLMDRMDEGRNIRHWIDSQPPSGSPAAAPG